MPVDPVTAAMIAKGVFSIGKSLFGKSKEEKAAEAARALDEERRGAFSKEEQARLAAARLKHGDTERSRRARANAIAGALGGSKYAIDPNMLSEANVERAFTDYQREYMPGASEMTKLGPGIGEKLFSAGDAAVDAYMKGLGGGEGGDGPVGAGAIVQAGQEAFRPQGPADRFDFRPKNCPPGTIC